ncbi:Hypothetical predicted protein [Cloeon dipterum]|uniref:DNA/RNA non-specific endonuclease/pyrophosphatase/phosphodiesterase domain-containing protein n=1 Tax=Cloeon dipterum TaxID=197152 RepID=A0A8S1CNR0_9INSE|nr:Hypothetical predicted protein [Cloeon dipterum]
MAPNKSPGSGYVVVEFKLAAPRPHSNLRPPRNSQEMRVLIIAGVLLVIAAAAYSHSIPRAGCAISINQNLPDPQALVINPQGTFDIFGFFLPQSGDIVTFDVGQEVLFACPGATLNVTGTAELLANCVDGTTFQQADGTQHDFSQLGCTKLPFHTYQDTGRLCGRPDQIYPIYAFGFELSNGDFYNLYEVCFDPANGNTRYSVFTQTPEIRGYQSGYPRPSSFIQGPFYYNGFDIYQAYTRDNQTAAIANIVGSMDLALQYVNQSFDSSFYLARGHLAAKADYVYGAHQRATFWYLNVAPQWQTFNEANWAQLEYDCRTYAGQRSSPLKVFTGTHGQSVLPDINGDLQPLYLGLDPNNNAIVHVPEIFWKVLYDPQTQEGVAFVGSNNPYLENPPGFIKCTDVCDQLTWLLWDPKNVTSGLSYCCEVNELAQTILEIPELTVSGLLT